MKKNTKRVGVLLAVLLGVVGLIGRASGTAVLQINPELSSFSFGSLLCPPGCSAAQEHTVSGTFQVNLDTEYLSITRIRFNPIKISTSPLTEGPFNFPEYPVEFVDPTFSGNGDPCNFDITPGSCLSQGNFGAYSGTFDGTVLTMTGAAPINGLYSYYFTIVATVGVLPSNIDSNSDGIVDTDAIDIGLDPYDSDGDTDNDGVSDVVELRGDVTNPRDADGDGVIDALEVGLSALGQSVLGFYINPTLAQAKGLTDLASTEIRITNPDGGALSAAINGTSGLPLYAEDDLPQADADYTYPFGIVDFSVAAPGGITTVTVEFPNTVTLPVNAVVRKLDASNTWVTFDNAVLDRANRVLTLTLTDNDDFDRDATAGIIRDPVGVGVPVTSASGDGGGGGCTLSETRHASPRIDIAMLLMLVVGLVRQQTRAPRRQRLARPPGRPELQNRGTI